MPHISVKEYVKQVFCAIATLFLLSMQLNAQCTDNKIIWQNLIKIDDDKTLSTLQKLQQYYALKQVYDSCNNNKDSVYGKLLLSIGTLEIRINKNYEKGFKYLEQSLRINASELKVASKYLALKAYFNCAFYYDEVNLYNKALAYYDSTIIFGKSFPDTTVYILYSELYKGDILFRIGDYQKTIEKSTRGIAYSINYKDSLRLTDFLNQRAQSLLYTNNTQAALQDADKEIELLKKDNYLYGLASALKLKANIFSKNQKFPETQFFFKKAIGLRLKTGNYEQIANDYIDYGNFFLDSLKDYQKAKDCYVQARFYCRKSQDDFTLCRTSINTAQVYLQQKNFKNSALYCIKAFSDLEISSGDNLFQNPSALSLSNIGDKVLAIVVMNTKAELLLKTFLQTKDFKYINACLNTCLVTDTLITKMRNTQLEDVSKLYWRNYTRDFYTNAIEACYLSGDSKQAFFFMEKSRSALLSDKLNNLNASTYLHINDEKILENFQFKIIQLQQQLEQLQEASGQYQAKQLQLINIKNDYDNFTKSLEQKYPAYYQYKYEDKVPTLKDLQNYLAKNNQNFVHYFIGDTVTYVLGITPKNIKFLKLSQNEFNKQQLATFLMLCANKQTLNNNYKLFISLSNNIYKQIFGPLQLPKGRTIICMDNIIIPFEALCSDDKGKQFLLNDYSFDYAYSARFLMKEFKSYTAKGNFAGFAPVSFAKTLNVVDLKNAATALNASAAFYNNNKLFTNQNATRHNFFNYIPSYSVVSIFSHAFADTTDNEPVLFMHDSLIHLSELQTLNKPATKLVLLSACQTNVGKTATGEGIYSLARGFATAGIPSVSATLWKADEETIYAISEKFNQYLSEGMNKDEALQKAKLYFIQHSSAEKKLPFYWANIILIGNTNAIHLTAANNYKPVWIAAAGVLVVISTIFFIRRKKPSTTF